MKIMHIAPNAPYNEGWGYQENILPRYHAKQGNEVKLVTTLKMHCDGKIVQTLPREFNSKDGFPVVRLAYKKYLFGKKISNILCKLQVYDELCNFSPDVIFYHGLISVTIKDVIRYKKKREKEGHKIFIIQDNHADYNNSKFGNNIKAKLLRAYYIFLNMYSQKYVDRIYGVTPWREQFAREYYRINQTLTDILIMGADDEQINFKNYESIRKNIRKVLNISDTDFLVISGGKIDSNKNIHILMNACAGIQGVKLVVFGSVSDEMKETFQTLIAKHNNILYVGWLASDQINNYYFAADLAVFPGAHSVLWEQACACKVPCLFKKWPGMEHVDNGGNSAFISDVTAEKLRETILELKFTEKYNFMNHVAKSDATDVYLYSNIARKSLECVIKK